MHPREFFWFSNTKYRLKVTEHEIAHLRLQAANKREKVRACKSNLTLDLVLTLLSHGALFWLYVLDERAIMVGKAKLAIISAELRKREIARLSTQPAPPPRDDEAIARDILSKMDDKQVAAVARVADQLLSGEAKGAEDHQRIMMGETSQSRKASRTTLDSEEEQPPPYERTDEQSAKP